MREVARRRRRGRDDPSSRGSASRSTGRQPASRFAEVARRILRGARATCASPSPTGPRMRARDATIARELQATRIAAAARRDRRRPAPFSSGWPTITSRSSATAEYELERGRASDRLVAVKGTGLGLLRIGGQRPRPHPTEPHGRAAAGARARSRSLFVTKANSVSTVHRATYLDYVGVKTFDARGRVTGERRFIGLFTSSTYSTHPRDIPLLRHKVRKVIDHIGVSPVSHDGKALHARARDRTRATSCFQSSVAELDRIARGIVNLYERRRVRLFIRRDPFQRYFSCMLFVPRDRYNTQVRGRIEQILREELSGDRARDPGADLGVALARLHTLVRTPPAAMSGRTWTGSSDASPRRCARGRTGCATSCERGMRRNARSKLGRVIRRRVPGRVPGRRARAECDCRHRRAAGSARGCRRARACNCGAAKRPAGAAPAPVPAQRAACDVGPAAAARELRPADPERAAVHDHARGWAGSLDPGPRGHARRRPSARPVRRRPAVR